ncbi:hypothetical protein EKD02_02590 [Chlorobium phaeovibrioides]|uniref:Uncharacterized protein n=1 Tax=Chlorobium phaeovibrioides TaxID=1094 RepID=A0A3S0U2D2_CHLPH|nr:hypothetical protein [Chlorobium phaeovibrioides]RTY39578.1 hypothetical protein EKD02_02590 [Chlorobium phaeovibrioides]
MASYEKLELTYLKILRKAIIFFASLSLVVVIVASAIGLFNIGAFNFPSSNAPDITSTDVVEVLTAKDNETPDAAPAVSKEQKEKDPFQEYYDRCYSAIHDFSTTHDPSYPYEFRKGQIRTRSNSLDEQDIAKAYVSGLADTLEKALKDNAVIELTKKDHALDIAIRVYDTYNTMFYENLQAKINKKEADASEAAMKRAGGLGILTFAGGAFLSFLLLAFLMIFVKIELNLRQMAEKN